MKVTINEDRNFQLEEIYNPIVLITAKKEKMSIVMRDSGFELWYQKDSASPYESYEFKDGVVKHIPETQIQSIKNIRKFKIEHLGK